LKKSGASKKDFYTKPGIIATKKLAEMLNFYNYRADRGK
jgi:hypothetical protein